MTNLPDHTAHKSPPMLQPNRIEYLFWTIRVGVRLLAWLYSRLWVGCTELLLLCEFTFPLEQPSGVDRRVTGVAGTFPSACTSDRCVSPRYAATPCSPSPRSPRHSAAASAAA